MKSIIILIPYFGRWPFWMDAFLLSCARNPSVHWLFFTDCGVPARAPDNVFFREISFEQYKQHAGEILGIELDTAQPYKLCDLRPAYGLIHEAEIRGFDFWGFGDIDVIYGDLRAYFDERRLARHQLLSCHERRISGHLTLLANTDLMRNAFRQVPEWADLMRGRHVAFDERRFSRLFLRHRSWPKWFRDWVYRNDPYMRNVEFNETYSTGFCGVPWIDGSFDCPTAWYWRDGKLTNNLTGEREFPYLHFVKWKQKDWRRAEPGHFFKLDAQQLRQGFMISAEGFQALPSSPERMKKQRLIAPN